ncbi:hypothetical protein COT72_03075 [archaeon CG10_big_fil_rev_8_21_14_0_10_43_11]|nr:MAG: hypothetical protein COT72_03075 [archaeon CG10_big_fil_rev_8_21_14_0_10_43_11]
MGNGVVDSSRELFGSIIGPLCVETILIPELELYCFENCIQTKTRNT